MRPYLKKKIKKTSFTAGMIGIAALLSGCGAYLEMPVGAAASAESRAVTAEGIGGYEITDKDYDTLEDGAWEIDLTDPADKEGVYTFKDRGLTIHTGGKYVLRGKLYGCLTVHVFEDESVHLILDNVEIQSDSGAAIYVEQAAKVILTAKEGTTNVLGDGMKYKDVQKACVFSNSDLTVNGKGILNVYAYYADGVRSKDQVKIVDTNLYVKAKEDGIRGNDGVILQGCAAEVECEGTGILSGSEKDMVILRGGSCKVVAGKNAILANNLVSIKGSLTDLYSVWDPISCGGILDIEEAAK